MVAGLRITGSAQQPRVDVFAEPAMSQEQALSYLILGRPLGSDSGDNNLLARAAIGLGLAGSSSLTSGLASRLGLAITAELQNTLDEEIRTEEKREQRAAIQAEQNSAIAAASQATPATATVVAPTEGETVSRATNTGTSA